MKTGLIYARQSFGAEEGSVSIEVQVENCKRWAKRNDVNIIGIYSDSNTSSELYPYCQEGIEACRVDRGFQNWKKEQRTKGRKEWKQGLGEAFDAIKAQKPDYIIVNTSNRLGRSATNSNLNNFMVAYLMEHNCSIVDAQANSITDFSDRLMMAFRAMKDALDYQGVFEKRKSSMESVARRINSFKVVSNAYGVITQNGVISFDGRKAEVIKYVYDAVCGGVAYSAILKMMNTKYRELADGRQFYQTNITGILNNLVYCGYAENKQGEVARAINIPAPVVSYSQYIQAQKIIKERKAGYQRYNVAGESRHWLPYSGYLYCECGRRMMVNFDNGICYKCFNGGEHKTRIRMNAENRGQDFNLALQSLFLLTCIKSRKELEASKAIDSRIDGLTARLARLEASLKAKFRMISSDDDFELLKDEIAEIKRNIAQTKQELVIAQEMKQTDSEAVADRVADDIVRITAGILLPEDDYQRLLADTIEKIIVRDDELEIRLKDGNSFNLPRLKVDGRGKKVLPYSTTSTDISESKRSLRYTITFHGGEEDSTLVETEDYAIYIKGE